MNVRTQRSRPFVARRLGLGLFLVGVAGYAFTIDGNQPTVWTPVDVAAVVAGVVLYHRASRLD